MRRIVRVPTSHPDMENAVDEINQTGDIVTVSSDGAGSLFVLVEAKKAKRAAPGEKETR